MAVCERCGNEYDKAFSINAGNGQHVFDCFECAIAAMAPHCAHCNTRIIGHGLEKQGQMFCCAHCAKMSGVKEFTDRV